MPERQRSSREIIRVLLCDDHAVVREGTRRLLEEEPDMEVVGEASDGLEAIEMVRKLLPHVVAMDISMPRMNGIDATRKIKELFPSVQVLALTAYDDFAYVTSLLDSGASGYLLKNARSEEILTAIRATALGDSVLDPKVAKEVFSRLARRAGGEAVGQPPSPSADNLTAKERSVLRFAASGRSNKEIAQEMGLSPRTVQTHLASVFSKMGVSSRTEAVIKGLRCGILRQADLEEREDD